MDCRVSFDTKITCITKSEASQSDLAKSHWSSQICLVKKQEIYQLWNYNVIMALQSNFIF